jgi:membrane protease YdiL (CAAX protease family)
MLGPVAYRPLFLLHCIFMALVPWVLLTQAGRAQVGLKASTRPREYPLAIFYGALASSLCFAMGYVLFGASGDNWFVSVGNSFRAQPTVGFSIIQLHLMFTIPGMIFSPIGEEIFFRGYFQRCLETKFSSPTSTLIEGAWFGGVHLIHHGIVLTAAGLSFRPLSGALWFLLMLSLSCMFAWLRKRHDSIIPAILSHSAFNLTMNAFIFAYLWTGTKTAG